MSIKITDLDNYVSKRADEYRVNGKTINVNNIPLKVALQLNQGSSEGEDPIVYVIEKIIIPTWKLQDASVDREFIETLNFDQIRHIEKKIVASYLSAGDDVSDDADSAKSKKNNGAKSD